MTNEELVELIQNGQTEYIPQLWDQVYLFICSMAKKRLIGEKDYIKQLEDDLVNEAYFDFVQAVEGYKFDQDASFLHYLTFHLKNSFNRALGLRTNKDRKNPMRYAASLDASVEGTEEITLQDMIIDHLAEEDYHFIEKAEFWQDVHELLEQTILAVTTGPIQEAYLIMLHENCSFADARRKMKIPENEQNAMYSKNAEVSRHIRRHLRGRAFKQCQRIGLTDYFHVGLRGTGLTAYRQHCFTSSTERAAIWKVDSEAWSRKIAQIFS